MVASTHQVKLTGHLKAGVKQLGALGTPGYRAEAPWEAVTTWERQRLTGRGRPKVRGEHVYRYTIGSGAGPTIGWQSNYFPRSPELVRAVVDRLGEPKELPYQTAKQARAAS